MSASASGGDDMVEREVRAWLAEHWDPALTVRQWWSRLADAGLGLPSWPAAWFGRGWKKDQIRAAVRAFGAAGAIGGPTGLGTLMGGPIVVDFGNDDQKRRLLEPLARGTEGWCQLFSEPGAGSDLAAVSTTAQRDGDEWVVHGQKVWTSGAAHSARGMLVARTDWDAPKHRGLTYFIIDMRQPGVEVRPLRQMNGRSHFSEVFFHDARVADADRIGDVGGGWAVTVATLAYERSGLSAVEGIGVRPPAGELAGALDVPLADLLARRRPGRPRGEPDEDNDAAGGAYRHLVGLARSLGRTGEADIRGGLARLYSLERIAGFNQSRAAANSASGRAPGPEASIAKLFWTEGLKVARDLGLAILGPHGTLLGADTPGGGRTQYFALTVPSASIAGGSDQIQRNIIGERALGLPREAPVDAEGPFRLARRQGSTP